MPGVRPRLSGKSEDSGRVPVRGLRTRRPCGRKRREEHLKGGTRPVSLWNEHFARIRGVGAGTHRSGLTPGRRRNLLRLRRGGSQKADITLIVLLLNSFSTNSIHEAFFINNP